MRIDPACIPGGNKAGEKGYGQQKNGGGKPDCRMKPTHDLDHMLPKELQWMIGCQVFELVHQYMAQILLATFE